MAGPFGTFETQPFSWRLVYWTVVIGVSIPIAFACRLFWRQVIGGEPALIEDILVIGTMSAIFGPLVVGFNIWLAGPAATTSIGWPLATIVTFLVGLGIVVIRRWMQSTNAPHVARDRLLDRIGAPQGVRLARVSSDNHHIRIVTDDGKEYRILMRLRDAVAEIDVEDGLCVHRSHWVALAQIEKIDFDSGKEIVRMPCGARVPIGPKYRGDLVDHGIIAA